MFPAFLAVVTAVVFYAPLLLIATGCVWAARHGRMLPRVRLLTFCAGLLGCTAAYTTHYVMPAYLCRAHLDFWQEVHVIGRVGNLMIIVALVSFVMSLSGKAYGRVMACFASVLIAVSWFLTQVASF